MAVGKLYVELRAKVAKFAEDMDGAARKVRKVGFQMQDIGRGLTAGLTVPIAGIGIASVKMATDAAESFSKFETVFGPATAEMSQFIDELMQTVPGTSQQLQEMTSSLQDLLVPMGVVPEDALEMNKKFVALAGDIASFNSGSGATLASVMDNIRSGLVGSSEPLQKFGVDVRVAAVEAKALELGLLKTGQKLLDLERDTQGAVRAQAVLAIVTEESTFALGDAARTADSMANSLKFVSRDVKELGIKLGMELLPIAQKVLNEFVRPFVEYVGEWVDAFSELEDETQTIIIAVAAFAAALGPVVLAAGFLVTNLSALIPVLGSVALGIKAVALTAVGLNPLVLAFAAVAAAVIYFDDEIANAIVDFLDFLRITDSSPPLVGKSAAAFNRVAESIGVSSGKLEEFIRFNKDALTILGDHRDEIDDLKKSLDEGKITHGQYEAKLRSMIGATKAATEATGGRGGFTPALIEAHGAAADTAENMQELADKVKGLVDAEREAKWAIISIADELGGVDEAIRGVIQAESDLQREQDALASQMSTTLNIAMADSNQVFADAVENIQTVGVSMGETGEAAETFATTMGNQISTIVNDVSKALVDMVFDWNFSWQSLVDGFAEIGKGVMRAITESFITPLTEQLAGVITGFVKDFIGIGGKVAGGAAGSAAGGGVPGSSNAAGNIAGGLAGGPITGIIAAGASVVSAVADAISAYQLKRMADRLFLIDVKMHGVVGNTTGANIIGNELVRQNWFVVDHLYAMRSMIAHIKDHALVKIAGALPESSFSGGVNSSQGVSFDDMTREAGKFKDVMLDGIFEMIGAAEMFREKAAMAHQTVTSSSYVQNVIIPEINRADATRQRPLRTGHYLGFSHPTRRS